MKNKITWNVGQQSNHLQLKKRVVMLLDDKWSSPILIKRQHQTRSKPELDKLGRDKPELGKLGQGKQKQKERSCFHGCIPSIARRNRRCYQPT